MGSKYNNCIYLFLSVICMMRSYLVGVFSIIAFSGNLDLYLCNWHLSMTLFRFKDFHATFNAI